MGIKFASIYDWDYETTEVKTRILYVCSQFHVSAFSIQPKFYWLKYKYIIMFIATHDAYSVQYFLV